MDDVKLVVNLLNHLGVVAFTDNYSSLLILLRGTTVSH